MQGAVGHQQRSTVEGGLPIEIGRSATGLFREENERRVVPGPAP